MSTKRKAPGKLAAPAVKPSAKAPTKSAIDESRTVVADTDVLGAAEAETIDISSDGASDEDMSDDDDEQEEQQQAGNDDDKPVVNGSKTKTTNGNAKAESDDEDDDGEATFGELLRNTEVIDVPALLLQQGQTPNRTLQQRTALAVPSGQSLTTVLTQALRTDDTDLLESCLHTKDPQTIRNTIEAIDSSLAGDLLTRLASRLYRRPGRAGSLMVWVQYTLVAHGGALASQPKVIQSLSGLQRVLAERAKGLGSLLALKGKLDLLEGQMDMRRRMQRTAARTAAASDDGQDDDVVYVEGEDDDDDVVYDEDDDEEGAAVNGRRVVADSSDDEEDLSDDADAADDDSDDDESLAEDDVVHDDVDESMGEDEDSDAEAAAAPPSKVQKTAKAFSKRR